MFNKSAEQLLAYTASYKHVFTNGTRSVLGNAQTYVTGLFKTEKKKGTCTGMSKVLSEANGQNLQHLLGASPWHYDEVMQQVSDRSNARLKGDADTCLLLDEFSFVKSGSKSVGVGRQYLGCVGKNENGQVVVGLTQNCGKHSSLINARLYLPKNWTSDEARMEQSGVPALYQAFKTKLEIALDLIDESIANGVYFNWLDMDSLYGRSLDFLAKLDHRNLTFVGDIPENMLVYETKPVLYVPPKKAGRGRPPSKLVTDTPSIAVSALKDQVAASDWQLLSVRHATKGDVLIEGYKKRVWLWDQDKDDVQSYILFIKKPINYDDQISYSLSNVSDEIPLQRIAFMQGQRFFVEHTYKEGKNQVGLGDYQVRSWQGLHKHLALCMMALNFLMEIRMDAQELGFEYVTAADIRELICFIIPNKITSIEQLIDQLKAKHQQYQKEILKNKRKSERLFVALE